jgi:hypothetical protein
MRSSVGLLSVSGDVVILLVLAAIARPGVSSLARPVIGTLAFVCAWLTTGVSAAAHAPSWTVFVGGAAILASVMVIIATLHLWTLEAGEEESVLGRQGDHGGGGPRPDSPQDGSSGGSPGWWPEFERGFALYVAEREQRRPAVLADHRRLTR